MSFYVTAKFPGAFQAMTLFLTFIPAIANFVTDVKTSIIISTISTIVLSINFNFAHATENYIETVSLKQVFYIYQLLLLVNWVLTYYVEK